MRHKGRRYWKGVLRTSDGHGLKEVKTTSILPCVSPILSKADPDVSYAQKMLAAQQRLACTCMLHDADMDEAGGKLRSHSPLQRVSPR